MHFQNFFPGGIALVTGLPGLEHHILQREILLEKPHIADKVVLLVGFDDLSPGWVQLQPRLLPDLPQAGGETVIPGLGSAAGTFPHAAVALVGAALGQQITALTVPNPDVDH